MIPLYHSKRYSFQKSNHFCISLGCTKNCKSHCSNSRWRNRKLPGVTSLRKAFPIWQIPKGICIREDFTTQVSLHTLAFNHTDVRLHHQVEDAWLCEFPAANRTFILL